MIRSSAEEACILCKDSEIDTVIPNRILPDAVSVLKCRHCGLVFLRSASENGRFEAAESEYWDRSEQEKIYFEEKIQNSFRQEFEARLETLERFVTPGKILDVGCGVGHFLEIAKRRGWDVKGLDISGAAAKAAFQRYGIPVEVGTLEKSSVPETPFDVIALWDVIEHIRKPLQNLEAANRLLRKGGILIMKTPNEEGFFKRIAMACYRTFGRRGAFLLKYVYYVPHYFSYSKFSLERLLESCGFEMIHHERDETPYEFAVEKIGAHYRQDPMRHLVTRFLPLAAHIARAFGQGNKMIVYARKVREVTSHCEEAEEIPRPPQRGLQKALSLRGCEAAEAMTVVLSFFGGLMRLCAVLFTFAGAILLDAFVIEPNWIAVRKIEIKDPALATFLLDTKIVHLTDLHLTKGLGYRERQLIQKVNRLDPDLIFITGDFIDDKNQVPAALELIRSLEARIGIFGVAGNTDHIVMKSHELRDQLMPSGMDLLINESRQIDLKNGRFLWLVGLDDPKYGYDNLRRALGGIPYDLPLILLAHSPHIFEDAAKEKINLVLVGDTHGGQVGIPFLVRLSDYANRGPYMQGLFQKGKTQMYVNRGIGTKTLPIRFLCRPEIAVIQVKAS